MTRTGSTCSLRYRILILQPSGDGITTQPAIDPLALRRWHLLKQLGEFQSTKPFQFAHIDMPESFSLPDETSLGTHLLPVAQAQPQRIPGRRRGTQQPSPIAILAGECSHDSRLMPMPASEANRPGPFGLLKQILRRCASGSGGKRFVPIKSDDWEREILRLSDTETTGPGALHGIIPTETC